MRNKTLVWVAGIVGIVFIVFALLYWFLPAGSLPSFLPGYQAGATTIHHIKHGLVSFVLGLLLICFVWFQSGPSHKRLS